MTTNATRHFIEPLDVLFLRGNKLFGDPGSFGESLIPPWPSVAAGAIRSALLAHRRMDVERFAESEIEDPELGTPERPGAFRVLDFRLARRRADGRVEPLYAPPADLVIRRNDDGALECLRMRPHALPGGILSSAATPQHAVLPERERRKPETGWWLTQDGWRAYLEGREIDPQQHLVRSADLWSLDTRVGVGLDPAKRSAAEGRLFTVQAVALRQRHHDRERAFDVGFLVKTEGAELPDQLTLRFGGDGRAAIASRTQAAHPEPDLCDQIARDGRCRLVLTSPGLFAGGWMLTGAVKTAEGELRFELQGIKARIVCAAVPRPEVVSGWDLAKRQPKVARRVAPTGSVYWLDQLQATADQLRKLAAHGLWSEPVENPVRRVEGFNRFTFATY